MRRVTATLTEIGEAIWFALLAVVYFNIASLVVSIGVRLFCSWRDGNGR